MYSTLSYLIQVPERLFILGKNLPVVCTHFKLWILKFKSFGQKIAQYVYSIVQSSMYTYFIKFKNPSKQETASLSSRQLSIKNNISR